MSTYAINQITGPTTITVDFNDGYYVYYFDCTSGNIIANLRDITGYDGVAFRLFRVDGTSNTLTINAYSGQYIDGSSYFNLVGARASREIVSLNNNWFSY